MNAAQPAAAKIADIDRFVVRVRLWMAGGLLLGATTAWYLETRPEAAASLLGDPGAFWALIATTVFAAFMLGGWRRGFSEPQARWAFLGWAALNGAALSALLRSYVGVDVAPALLAAAGAFLAADLVSVRGARPATVWAWMGATGLLLAGPLSRRLGGARPEVLAAYAAVLVFTVLSVIDDERVRRLGAEAGGEPRAAARGALALYLDALDALLRPFRR